jgi:hypothetical protein
MIYFEMRTISQKNGVICLASGCPTVSMNPQSKVGDVPLFNDLAVSF